MEIKQNYSNKKVNNGIPQNALTINDILQDANTYRR